MYKKIIFTALILLISMGSVNAVEIPYTNPYGLTEWVAPEGSVFTDPNDYENVLAICNDTRIKIVSYPYFSVGGTETDIFYGPTGVSIMDAVFTPEYMFVVFSNGQVYRVNQWFGQLDWETEVNIGGNAFLVTTVPTTSGTQALTIDENGFVYVSGGNMIYKINPETLTTTSSSTGYASLYSLSMGTDGIYTGHVYTGTSYATKGSYSKWSTMNSYDTITYFSTQSLSSGSATYISGMDELTDGNYFIFRTKTGTAVSGSFSVEYANATNSITILDYVTLPSPSSGILLGDSLALPNGIGFVTDSINDKIYTYELTAGGIGFSNSNYVPAKLTYTTTDIYTDYQNYYNGSNVDVHFAIAFDTSAQLEEFRSFNYVENRFQWKIELINPSGVLVNSYIIPENFERDSILSFEHFIVNSVTLNNINPNGTWQLNLFEIDTQTNEKSLLDFTTFNILYDKSGSTGIGTGEIIINNPIGISNNIIQSSMFYAIIIILVCGGVGAAYGGGVGFVGGAVMGVVACAAFGLLPMLYVVILVIVFAGLLASGLANKVTGG